MLANLLFTVPFAVFTAIFVLIGYLTGFNNLIVWMLGIIPAFPLYAGFVMVVRKYSVEKTNCDVIKVFFDSVKGNLKKSLANGVIVYAIGACSVLSLLYYWTASKTDIIYSSMFTILMLFTLLIFVMMFYVPLMTVTYELRLRDIYKNSFWMILDQILKNIGTLLLVGIFTLGAVVALVFTEGVWFVISAVLTVLLYPLIYTYIVVSMISKGLQDSVGSFTATPEIEEPAEDEIGPENQAFQNAESNNDYIFVNGRMIKNPAKKDKTEE